MAGFIVSHDNIDEIIKALREATADAVEVTAKDIAGTYSETAARETGFMASSAYVVTKSGSTYGSASGSGPMLPAIPQPEDDQTAIAAVAAAYGADVEYGTIRMAAQPAFHPALDKAAKTLEDELSKLEGKIAKAGLKI